MGKTMQGGRRPGSGRPRKGEGLRKSVSFTLSPVTIQKARELRTQGLELNRYIEDYIGECLLKCYNEGLIPIVDEPKFEQTESGYIVHFPCIKVK